ncbi:NUDIX domain-containing protein [Streptomyces sp. SID10815]|uniref:NUDIX hydrolase n=1 Tax=Streptomyces sp. SID10815 TaxID=2706027 RepID=UPI0013C6E41B|nr:NUDIX domain-containing protein [Streptomyces sp. SID10815]NEA45706.1 NUDIX domain-containing protein [Streptomyces sp. SID10815]
MATTHPALADVLARHEPRTTAERADTDRARALVAAGDAWGRAGRLHVTASAVIVHPDSGRVLLRRHPRHRSWLLVGGHGDPGEDAPLDVALREGREETGLPDLAPWPDAAVAHLVIVPVPAGDREPAHEHADLRYVLATAVPDSVRPENPDAPLRWLTPRAARETVTEANVRATLERVAPLLER